MTITLVAYSFLEPGGAAPDLQIRSVSDDIRRYLAEHIDDLLARAARGSSAPAFFRDANAEQRFIALRDGSQDQFLAAATELSGRLYTAMDRRSKRGFFVAARRAVEPNGVQVAGLKLDVHDEPAAAARRQDGELRLEAVQDLLDLPGELQKGAVYPDPRAESDVVVGDRVMIETAQYFLRALEVQQIAAPASATKSFLDAVSVVAPNKVAEVAEELDRHEAPLAPEEFFDEHPDLLSEEERQTTSDRLAELSRPVRVVNPAARPPRGVVVADGITIRGAVEEINKVRWEQRASGWQIQIDVAEEPRRRYE